MEKPLVELNYTEKDGMMLPNIQVSNNQENDRPLGRYGRLALEYLRESHPQRYMTLKMDGTLMEKMHQVNEEALKQIEALTQQMLQKKPMPDTEDTLERTKHLNSLRRSAEEIVLRDLVLKPR
ncbi:Transposon-encoded protein TnpV [Caprobacter fermentans]|uniref:TnpV protein n=1 Tax=Caproicibacter fermentans TaxID=2576756 RepID=A0A6N8HX89_9FIRM|nr:TnpV protein [Caproicibacter fermentans]MVB10461.1 Transposon-encoded protein TnpV [Caproicibacter fermentans]QNK40502.1 TnpV protein [Caproicibacter fermentans]